MFVNEAKISALLAHPNIVQIFEFGEAAGSYFIAMESVRGVTLREVMIQLREQGRTMPVVAAAEITGPMSRPGTMRTERTNAGGS